MERVISLHLLDADLYASLGVSPEDVVHDITRLANLYSSKLHIQMLNKWASGTPESGAYPTYVTDSIRRFDEATLELGKTLQEFRDVKAAAEELTRG